jgi:ATP-dependent Clp protease protease subunit
MSYSPEVLDRFLERGVHTEARLIHIFGELTTETSSLFLKAMDELERIDPSAPIEVTVSSEGGSWADALAIYDRISQSKCHIKVVGTGLVGSAATAVFQAADERALTVNCQFLIHDGSEAFEGTPRSFRSWAKASEANRRLLYEIYAFRSGRAIQYWEARCSHDTWLSAEETVADGLADYIQSPPVKKFKKFAGPAKKGKGA